MTDILDRLRGYNPPDRTEGHSRVIAQDIHDAANEIHRLRSALGYAYQVVTFGFEYGSFDFSALRKDAAEWRAANPD